MNTTTNTSLQALLAPLTGGNSSDGAQNTALFNSQGPQNRENSDFASLVQKLRSQYDRPEDSESPEETAKESTENSLGDRISALLSGKTQQAPEKEQTANPSKAEAVLSDIAALMQVPPQQISDPESLQLAIEGFLAENPEKLQEINDLIGSLPQNNAAMYAAPVAVASTTPENSVQTPETTLPTTPENSVQILETPMPTTSVEAGVLTKVEAAIPTKVEAAIPENPEMTKPMNAEASISPVLDENSGQTIPQAALEAGGNDSTGKTVKIPLPEGNSAPTEKILSDLQTATSNKESTTPTADQLVKMVQDTETEAAANETSSRQMNLSPEQIVANQAQTQKNPLSGETFKTEIEVAQQQTAGDNSIPDTTSVESIANAPKGDSAISFADSSSRSEAADVARQIQESITSSYRAESKQVVVRLDPPELGKVTIRFIEKSDGITGVLQVDQAQTRQDIERALPEIIQNLQNAAIQIKKVEVVSTDQQQGYDTSREESAFSGQEGGFDQQDNPHSSSHRTGYHEPSANFDNFTESAQSSTPMTEKSINMLI